MMNNLLKDNKNFFTFSLVILMLIPMLGIKFFISLIGNILILLFLIPILLLILLLIGFNSYKSKINKCRNCGTISLGLSETCINCGAEFNDMRNVINLVNKPSESTIEVKAEEIK